MTNRAPIEMLEPRRLLAGTRYVSPRGDDAASGSRDAPWRTIQHAADVASAGTTVVVLAGVYHERVTIRVSGNKASGFVTFRGNRGAVISGENVRGEHLVQLSGRQYVAITGFELRDNLDVNDGSAIRLEGWGRKIRIAGNTIHHTRGESAMAITVYGSDARRGFSSVTIEDNRVYDCEPAPSEAITLNGNVSGFTVRRNDIRDVNNIAIDAIGGEGICADPTLDAARNGTIAENVVVGAHSNYEDGYAAGIYVDGGRDLIVERNRVSDSDLGIEIGAENAGVIATRVTVRNNLLVNNDKAGLAIGGYDADRGRVTNSVVRNNTFIRNDQAHAGNGEIWVQYADDCLFTNNAVLTNAQALAVNVVAPTTGNRFDFNVFASASANPLIFNVQDAEQSFAQWQAAGRDAHSKVDDLDFADAANGDYRPAIGSPLIAGADRTTRVSSDERDLLGHQRKRAWLDVGAIEY